LKVLVKGAKEHNLKNVDLEIGDGLTVVTGVSGSGKTSLVFDTIYQEARRRFEEAFSHGRTGTRLTPPRVDSITGLGPAVAVGQNLLNRNPNSTLATASGLHPFLRLLYARFGARPCPVCGEEIQVIAGDQLIERIRSLNSVQRVTVHAPLLRNAVGSHRALLRHLEGEFGSEALLVDGYEWNNRDLNPSEPHSLEVEVAEMEALSPATAVREALAKARALGADAVRIRAGRETYTFSTAPICSYCGHWLKELRPQHFNRTCPHCGGDGCEACHGTGLHPEASNVTYAGLKLPELLALSVDEAAQLFDTHSPPESALRLRDEIAKRLEALGKVGLGYLFLNRPSPSLSRGESQRVRLAVALTSRLEDVLHVLDEPTIGQHPHDVSRLLPAFRELGGPVLYVEHDRVAAAEADSAVEIGPGAGAEGGEITFTGTPSELWDSDTVTGRYFSLRERVKTPEGSLPAKHFITVQGAYAHNLRDVIVKVPLGRLSVVTGVSGSGKSTLVEDVLVASLRSKKPVGCEAIEGPRLKPVLVDQSPIGRNPRSTPATYTKLSDTVRDLYAERTGMSPSHFSFNRPEGACPACGGMGAVEVKMRYLPSTWVTCTECEGRRYNDDVLDAKVSLENRTLSIADLYELSIAEASRVLTKADLDPKRRRRFGNILRALTDIGLGYLSLGQPSPTLSGGEAQRVKLARYLGRGKLRDRLIVLDEPSTGLHPRDINGLLVVLDRLVKLGATVVVVEHNTDIIKAADWVIDLGPGAGPIGGEVLYMGDYGGLDSCTGSLTARALREEDQLVPRSSPAEPPTGAGGIAIRGARANNLRDVDVDFPKNSLTVVTGVSGSGKSSLVSDTLETEARRRYLETLSLYERQGTKEGPEAPVDDIKGLGVTVSITPDRWLYNRRSTVGTVTEIFHHLSAILSVEGERHCLECGSKMTRGSEWTCPKCGATAPVAPPRRFNPRTYAAACQTCNGVGSLQRPLPEKLIRHPEKPLCAGAMHSPGFFPQGFLCKPGNSGYDMVQAFAARHGFDPATTPWNRIPEEVRQMFLYGDPEPLEVTFRSHIGRVTTRTVTFRGFYAWIGDWDVGGTYTENVVCPTCNGARLRPEHLAVTIGGRNIHQLCELPLGELKETLDSLNLRSGVADHNLRTARRRLRFLCRVGLGYINLNRVAGTLSAGEAQRVRLAGLLGSGVTSLTVLLDEPTRGMHPDEVHALLGALQELRDEGNTVIVVEHDPDIIRRADHVIDVGPGPGAAGGLIVAQGTPEEVAKTDTSTSRWLRAATRPVTRTRRKPERWMIVEGARENNLKAETIRIPLGVLVGVCGVSGSGKSTLMIDTVGRALSPVKQTTSVAREPVDPGAHDRITGAPPRTLLVDQSRRGIRSPATYLDLLKPLRRLYAESEDAAALGLTEEDLSRGCSVCGGTGFTRMEMDFLPDILEECETCMGTGYAQEAWDVRLHGFSLPELNELTLSEVHGLFGDESQVADPIKAAMDVGLGYLALRQPGAALSGGEAQRLKIASELRKRTRDGALYILDEPTVGQHMEDIERLKRVLHRLVDEGNSVVVVEHSPSLLADCDWLIELGPEGGPGGGWVVAEGPPEQVAGMDSPTAKYICLELGTP
jgi:excinuclease ABC subunit A